MNDSFKYPWPWWSLGGTWGQRKLYRFIFLVSFQWVWWQHGGAHLLSKCAWSARKRSLEIRRHGWELNPGQREDRQWDHPKCFLKNLFPGWWSRELMTEETVLPLASYVFRELSYHLWAGIYSTHTHHARSLNPRSSNHKHSGLPLSCPATP